MRYSRVQRGIVTGTIAAALWLTSVGLLWIVGGAAAYQALRSKPGPGHLPTLLTFAGLVLALAWFFAARSPEFDPACFALNGCRTATASDRARHVQSGSN